MPIYELDPRDRRWRTFVESHEDSSIYHTPEWLEALRRTYHYEPTVFTTNAAHEPLTNGIVFCRIQSYLTGSRLVSLPFSDHCELLATTGSELATLLPGLQKRIMGRLRHVEIRPRLTELEEGLQFWPHKQHYFHVLDLTPTIEELYSKLHYNGVRRKIRRADRERVELEQGQSESILMEFYQLLLLTRRRHRIPPQPLSWFRNLIECLGPNVTIHVARFENRPIACVFTMRHKTTVIYKYGCSDERFHRFGAMPRLLWQVIEQAKAEHMQAFDLGRSDFHNEGLVRFKDHLGARKTILKYWRSLPTPPDPSRVRRLPSELARNCLQCLPDSLFRLVGQVFYRHLGSITILLLQLWTWNDATISDCLNIAADALDWAVG